MSSSSRTYSFSPSDRPAKKQRLAVMHATSSGGAPHPMSIVYPTIQSFVAVGQNKRGRDDNSIEDQENKYGSDRGSRRQLIRYGEQDQQQPRRIRRKISPPTPTSVTTNEQPFYPIQGYSYMNGGCN